MDVENLMFLQMKVEDLAVQIDVENLAFLQMKVEDLAVQMFALLLLESTSLGLALLPPPVFQL